MVAESVAHCGEVSVFLEKSDAYVYRHFQNVHDVFGVEVLFQAGVQNIRENALVMLIAQSLYEPGFTQLRTVEQLGYIVSIEPRQNAGTIALVFVIQGPGSADHASWENRGFPREDRGECYYHR
ncbi:hypothetical protein COOONC_06990 [Cooperia oncophora]